jgi:hypothetical protein
MTETIKRVYKLSVVVNGATKEFQEGLGVGVLMTAELTFNLTQKQYDSPMFPLALADKQRELINEVISTNAVLIS